MTVRPVSVTVSSAGPDGSVVSVVVPLGAVAAAQVEQALHAYRARVSGVDAGVGELAVRVGEGLRHAAGRGGTPGTDGAGSGQERPPGGLGVAGVDGGVDGAGGPRLAPRGLIAMGAVAARLGVSPRTVRRLVASGDLPVVKVGRASRFRDEDVAAFERRGGVKACR